MKVIALEEHFRSGVFRDVQAAGGFAEQRDSPVVERVIDKLYDVGPARIADLDAAGIDVQVLSHTPPGPEALGADLAADFARRANDELASLVSRGGGRYAGFGMLPVREPEQAAAELRRIVNECGLVGAMVHGTVAGEFLDGHRFWPIFEEAARLRVPIYLHPAPPQPPIRAAYFSGFSPDVASALATSAWGWHVETGLHLLRLVVAGVFDAYPDLQVIVGHMGEAIPFMLARFAGVMKTAAKLDRPIADYFRQNVYYTTSGFFTLPPLRCLVDTVGLDRIMFAVDYPFSDSQQGTRFLDSLPFTGAEVEDVAGKTAASLLRLQA